MPVRDYRCQLIRKKRSLLGENGWENVGALVPRRIDRDSAFSKMDALLSIMKACGGRESQIERYQLELWTDDGTMVATLEATAADLERHMEGYLESAGAAYGDDPGALAAYSDEQLLAELRRRLGR